MKFVVLAIVSLYIVVPTNGGIALTPTLPILSTYPVLNTGVEYYYGAIPANNHLSAYHKSSQVHANYNKNQNSYQLSVENARRRLHDQEINDDLENSGEYYYNPRKSANYLSSYKAATSAESKYKNKHAYNYQIAVGGRRNIYDADVVPIQYEYPASNYLSSYKKTSHLNSNYNKKNSYKYKHSIVSSRRNNNDEEIVDEPKENEGNQEANNCEDAPIETIAVPLQTYNDEDRLNFIKDICSTYIEKNNFFTDLIGDAKIHLFIADISDLLTKHCLEDEAFKQ